MTSIYTRANAIGSASDGLPLAKDLPYADFSAWVHADDQVQDESGWVETMRHTGKAATWFPSRGSAPQARIVNLGTEGAPLNVFSTVSAVSGQGGYELPIADYNNKAGFSMGFVGHRSVATGSHTVIGVARLSGAKVMIEILYSGTAYIINVRRATGDETVATSGNISASLDAWHAILLNVDWDAGTAVLKSLNGGTSQTVSDIEGDGYPNLEPTLFKFAFGGRPNGAATVANIARMRFRTLFFGPYLDTEREAKVTTRLLAERALVVGL